MPESKTILLDVTDLQKYFRVRRGWRGSATTLRAVDGVSFQVDRGETVGLVGESGSGKSTVARTVVRLYEPTAGSIRLDGEEIAGLERADLRRIRRSMQFVFQDPYSSLPERFNAERVVTEGLALQRIGDDARRRQTAMELFDAVGIPRSAASRYPHQFSGGQRQRLAIARALALDPDLLLLDEPVSALDVSIQAQIVKLLRDLQHETDMGYVFIAHDLAVVSNIADTVAVMYLGRIVEIGPADEVLNRPTHPYTKALIESVPVPVPRVGERVAPPPISGEIPSPIDPPSGCTFRTRCPIAEPRCAETRPDLVEDLATSVSVACIVVRDGVSARDAAQN